ncbi:LOW QUALITY PROTEIN: activator of 90 kDa heat shock protein ATPase homolog 2-like [Lycaon pictus]
MYFVHFSFKESGAKHKGLIEMPNLSEENEVDDTEVNVSKKKGDGDILKDLMKTAGTSKVREALGDYLKALKTVFTMGMILPTKPMATQDSTVKRKLRENTLQASPPVGWVGSRDPGSTMAMHMTELFNTTIEQLYNIFTTKDLVQQFSISPAVLEAEKGGKFQIFDGNITGEYIESLTNKNIVMKWRCGNWPEAPEHYPTVALNFVPTAGQTELQLDCKGVPVCKEESMKFCWQKHHFQEIKGLLQLTTFYKGILLNKAPFIYCQATAKEDSLQNQISCGCSVYK